MKRVLLLYVCVLLGAGMAGAQTPQCDTLPAAAVECDVSADGGMLSADDLWDRANTAYINGEYRAAAELYRRIEERGLASARLYYNLGNACFKEGRLGAAILYYRRALRIEPGNDDVRYNLNVAEARTKDTIERIPEFFLAEWLRAVRHTMGCTSWSLLSLALLALSLASAVVYLLARRLALRKAGFYTAAASLLLFVLATWFAAGERREMLDRTEGVVMTASVSAKSSPSKTATDLFVLHEGTTVRIGGVLDGWCEIVIADGKKGWIECRTIEVI